MAEKRRLEPFEQIVVQTGRRQLDSELLDEALYVSYDGPQSYTGEDMVEISTHGGVLIPREVFAALLRAGAREALADRIGGSGGPLLAPGRVLGPVRPLRRQAAARPL